MAMPSEENRREPERRTRYDTDIVALAQELQRLRENSFDAVAETKDLRMSTEAQLEIPNFGSYPLTRHGHQQVAEKTGIPFRYYEAMQERGFYDLIATNVNRWIGVQADRRLVRVADGRVRAVLSNRYRVLDNFDLAMMVMDRAKEHAAVVQRADLTETRMFVKLIVPEYREAVKAGDDVVPGLVVSNSEVGDGAFRVEPFLFRLVCANGVIGENTLYKVHLGQRLELGELIYTEETRKLADRALWAQVRDIVDSTFDTRMLRVLVEKLRGTQEKPIEKPIEVLDATAKNLDLSDEKKLDLLRYFSKEGETVFGLVNGISRLAQDFESYEDQVRLERYAGALLEAEVKA